MHKHQEQGVAKNSKNLWFLFSRWQKLNWLGGFDFQFYILSQPPGTVFFTEISPFPAINCLRNAVSIMQSKAKHAGPFKCRDKFIKVHVGKVYNIQWPVQLVALFQREARMGSDPWYWQPTNCPPLYIGQWSFFIHYIICTKDALRRPITYDNHPIPSHPSVWHIAQSELNDL